MTIKSLNRFHRLRKLVLDLRQHWLRVRVGVVVDPTASISLSSRLRPARPGSITVGYQTLIAFKALIYTRDHVTGEDRPVRIGQRCFIGGGSTVLPGVTIGDQCIVGAGSVVTEDVPPRCIVAGNPARVLRRDIEVGQFGRLKDAIVDDQLFKGWNMPEFDQ